jgi:hypothetical protein
MYTVFKYKGMAILPFLIFLLSCSEDPVTLHQKLDQILKDDLKFMVAEVMQKSQNKFISAKPYYAVKDFKIFKGDTARIFKAYAKVHFYYYKGVDVVQVRKYRYDTNKLYWDRYYKKLEHKVALD